MDQEDNDTDKLEVHHIGEPQQEEGKTVMESIFVELGISELDEDLMEESVEMSTSLDQVEDIQVGYVRDFRVSHEEVVTWTTTKESRREEGLVLNDQVTNNGGEEVIAEIENPFANLICTLFTFFNGLHTLFREHSNNLLLEEEFNTESDGTNSNGRNYRNPEIIYMSLRDGSCERVSVETVHSFYEDTTSNDDN